MLIRTFKEISSFFTITALSCGPSQVFGAGKLVLDTFRLLNNTASMAALSYRRYKLEDRSSLITRNTHNIVSKKLNLSKGELTSEQMELYLQAKMKMRKEKMKRIIRSAVADTSAFVPLLGAHISPRIAANYWGKSYTPLFTRIIAQLFDGFREPCGSIPFWGRGHKKNAEAKPYIQERFAEYKQYAIPVHTSTQRRTIDAYYAPASEHFVSNIKVHCPSQDFTEEKIEDSFTSRPTVILCHPVVGSAATMARSAEAYRQMGFNVLAVTYGGYPNSQKIKTSEASIYQDIEAVKLFLKEKGVTKLGWHGWSLGTGVAIDGASRQPLDGMKNLFAVAVAPYSSMRGVAGNMLGPLGRGFVTSACPSGRRVELPGGTSRVTDGLDSLTKARTLLKENNIPLICVEGKHDYMMGRGLKLKGGLKKNFARDLQQARYSEAEKSDRALYEDSLIQVNEGHVNLKNFNLVYEKLYKQNLLPEETMNYINNGNPIDTTLEPFIRA